MQQKQVKKVLFFCMGGHGRTGTAVGCLMTVGAVENGGQAIRHIREHYCERAVETKKQERYVRSMVARKVK
jgi:protein-tyrosine phosphatase